MKINVKVKAQVLNVNVNEKEGKKYYQAVLYFYDDVKPEAGTIGVNEDIARNLISGEKYLFSGCYNSDYKSFYLTGVEND